MIIILRTFNYYRFSFVCKYLSSLHVSAILETTGSLGTMLRNSVACLDDFESWALQNLAPSVLGYFQSGSNDQNTLGDNKAAFKR